MKDFIHRVNMWLVKRDQTLTTNLRVPERRKWLRRLAILITRSGDGLPFLIIMAVPFLLGGTVLRSRILIFVLGDILTFIVIQALKFIARRPRPPGKWGQFYRSTDPHSFPSGHAARGGVIAVTGMLLGPLWLAALTAVWGIAVALSRVAMGVHYVTDIAAGFLTGGGMAVLVALLIIV